MLYGISGRSLNDPASQTIVPIYKRTVSTSVATVDIENTDLDWTYWDSVIFKIRRLAVVTDDVEIYLRVYDTTLAAWQSDATDYQFNGVMVAGSTAGATFGSGDPEISMMNGIGATFGVGNGAGEAFDCNIEIHQPFTAGLSGIHWQAGWVDSTGNISSSQGWGYYTTPNPISGLRILAESGNIDDCKIMGFGVRGY